jgi:putative transposase
MLILEYKLRINQRQCAAIELANDFSFAARLNSMAWQAAADRAWQAIARFYANCKSGKSGKKGYPCFQHDNRSVEYKTSGWRLEADGQHITFTDGHGIGTLRLIGTRSIATFPVAHIQRVRLLKRADGYFVQFVVQADRQAPHAPTGSQVGIDMGLKSFYTDSDGGAAPNPRFLRKAETKLKRLHRRVSVKKKGSANRKKAIKRLAKAHLKVSRQRQDVAAKTARTLIVSHDLIAYEDLQIRHMVHNHHLAKLISDAAWGRFLSWLRYYGQIASVPVIAVPPAFTTQDCYGCGERVWKSLSVRTHVCPRCGVVLDRDQNAALNILALALTRTAGQAETGSLRVANASGQGTSGKGKRLPSVKLAG